MPSQDKESAQKVAKKPSDSTDKDSDSLKAAKKHRSESDTSKQTRGSDSKQTDKDKDAQKLYSLSMDTS